MIHSHVLDARKLKRRGNWEAYSPPFLGLPYSPGGLPGNAYQRAPLSHGEASCQAISAPAGIEPSARIGRYS